MDRKQFEEWFKTTDAYKLLEEMNYFKIDLFIFKEHRSQYQHTTVQIAYMTWQHQQAKVEGLKNQLIKHGLICPMCGVTELKEEVFLNDGVECLISKCAECGIETASSAQLKINKLTFSGRELQQKLQMALDVIECGKGVRGIFVQKFNAQQERIDAALKLIKDRSFWVMRNGCYEDVVIKEQIEHALKGEG